MKRKTGVEKVVSGGQAGVDRAALDEALTQGLEVGGYCPKGRRAEDGRIPERYPLRETASRKYAVRTRRNVQESDATLVLSQKAPTGGTALTLQEAHRRRKPVLQVRLPATADALAATRRWLREEGVRTLNVAGPRASEEEGVYEAARAFLERLLTQKSR